MRSEEMMTKKRWPCDDVSGKFGCRGRSAWGGGGV